MLAGTLVEMRVDTFWSFLASFLGGGIGAIVLTFVLTFLFRDWLAQRLKAAIEEEFRTREAASKIKREACLEALAVVDAFLSNQSWTQDGKPLPVHVQPIDIAMARDCYNRLALTCQNQAVIDKYLDALGLHVPGTPAKQVSGDAIVDLRNAMRAELGFGIELKLDRSLAWIGTLHQVTD